MQDKIGDYGIGTSFLIGEDLIVTAKHCIENFSKVIITDDEGNHIIPKKIIMS